MSQGLALTLPHNPLQSTGTGTVKMIIILDADASNVYRYTPSFGSTFTAADPAFLVNADPDPAIKINADLDPFKMFF
jgi:hypothetical protein